jgi:hypothetical protein
MSWSVALTAEAERSSLKRSEKEGAERMPWSSKQHKLFEAAAHDADIAREHGMSQKEARKLANEGVKKDKSASIAFIDLTSVFYPSAADR